MAFLNDPGLQALWQNVVARLNNLVEAVPGKGLSTNDYTDEDKIKVENAVTGIGNLNNQISGVDEKADEALAAINALSQNAVQVIEQTFTEEQKAQARANIGAVTSSDIPSLDDVLSEKMDAVNPVGEGTFSMGRMTGTTIGTASFTHGGGAEASGLHSYAKGLYPIASGEYSHAEGQRVEATGDYSYSFGNNAIATGDYAYSFGDNTEASSNYSHAEGYRSTATTDGNESVTIPAYGLYSSDYHCAHAEGYGTVACGIGSHTEGLSTKAQGEGAHAEGRQTVASGTCSHAEGYNTTSSGIGSHSEGQRTLADGDNSHAEGLYTKASGKNSHAEGEYTEALGKNQHVQGKNNILDEDNQFAHIVGNGSGTLSRSNAHTLDWDGNAWYQGEVYVGGTSQGDENATRLLKESEIATDDEILDMLIEMNVVTPFMSNNKIITNSEGKIYSL